MLTRAVWILSLVSLFTDISSEMLYPVLPVYLQVIGFSALWIGILEGFAEATVGLSKGYFGKWSDQLGKRLPFVQLGYFLSAVAKPMMVLFTWLPWIFTARCTERLGKGVRTAARDALLSDLAGENNKGKVFGFHRGMDTLGAALGPLAALAYLHYHPGHYKELFLIAFIPALLGVMLTFFIKEKKRETIPSKKYQSPFSFFYYWKGSGTAYKKTVIGLLAFAFFNSSDIFLLMMAKQQGLSDTQVILVYVFYNLVYALAAYPAGWLADKIGMKKIFIAGLVLFAIVYAGMSVVSSVEMMAGLFFLYGLYAAATDGIAKAWISGLCVKEETGTAIGFYASLQSIMTLLASTVAGMIWAWVLPGSLFIFSAAGALLIVVYFSLSRIDVREVKN